MNRAVVTPGAGGGRPRGLRRRALGLLAAGAMLAGGLAVPSLAVAGTHTGTTLSAAADPADERITWSVRPTPTEDEPERPNYSYAMKAGQTLEDSIRVRNFTTSELELAVYASDALNTETGAIDLLPAGEKPKDVGSWITLDKSSLRIPARSHVDVPFKLKVPTGIEGGDRTAGIVTSLVTDSTDESGSPVRLDRRLGTRVYLRVDGPLDPKLAITDFTTSYSTPKNPAGRGTMHITYKVTNAGNVRMAADQAVTVKGFLGIPKRTDKPGPMPELLPGNSLVMKADVDGVWPAIRSKTKLTLTPVPTRAGDQFQPGVVSGSAQAGNWTPPWALLIFLILAIGGPTANRRSRRRRQAREDLRFEAAVAAATGGTQRVERTRAPGRRRRRAAALLGSLAIWTASPAVAAPTDAFADMERLGALAISPASGDLETPITLTTAGGCPHGTNSITRVYGKGFPSDGENVIGNSEVIDFGSPPEDRMTAAMTIPIAEAVRRQQDPPTLSGIYTLRFSCQDRLPTSPDQLYGVYVGELRIDGDSYTALTTADDLPDPPSPKAGSDALNATPLPPTPQDALDAIAAQQADAVPSATETDDKASEPDLEAASAASGDGGGPGLAVAAGVLLAGLAGALVYSRRPRKASPGGRK